MPPTPLPPGEPVRPRDGEIRWFEPVIVARRAAGQSAAGGAVPSPPPLLRRPAIPWREAGWVGFAGDGDAPARGKGAMPPPRPPRIAAAKAAPPARAEEAARNLAALSALAGIARWLRRRLGCGIRRVLRLGAAAASVGAVVIFAYQGGEHLAGLAGAMTQPSVAPGRQAAVFSAPDDARAPAMPPSDPIERAAYYLNRARAGDPLAQYNLAVLYARGDGLVQDFFSAAGWFREAALAGNAAAQFDLAVIYQRGLGVRQNLAEAIAWYRRAAERNYPAAQYNLALLYAEGRGVPQDAGAAARWYRRAAARGLVPAMVNFAILYEKGEGVERSSPDAYSWYRAAARRGDGAAAERAGELFRQFAGPDKAKAVLLAATLADILQEPSAAPSGISPKPAGPGGAVTARTPGGPTGRAMIEPGPGPLQPPG